MFLKQKKSGKIKARGCADGRKERSYHVLKENSSAPFMSFKALLLSCVIEAKEEMDVTFIEIPGVFLPANVNGEVHVKLEGTMAKLITQLDLELHSSTYLQEANGMQVLYVLLL